MHYWEDFEIGRVDTFGEYAVTADEIVEFSEAYDPLPFHTDPVAAAQSPYGGLIAPGLLTCAMFMRMLVDHVLLDAASMGSPGVDSVRWLAPVRPGDTLSVRQEVLDARVLRSRPGLGLVKSRFDVRNQIDESVCELISNALFAKRPVQSAS